MNKSTLRVRVVDSRLKLAEMQGLTALSAKRFDEIVGRFEQFLKQGFDIDALDEITAEHVELFINANGRTGPPSVATRHMRRTSLRLLFRVARTEFGFEGDPTLDVILPSKTGLATRPLTDDEVALGRSYSLHTQTSTRLSAAWALSEATAITAELPYLVVDDLDLDNARVWLHGSTKRDQRWGYLSGWGVQQLKRRVAALSSTDRLVFTGRDPADGGQQSCCASISDTLVRAGLITEPDVRPASLVAWAGSVIFGETDKIEEVARRLGMRSLDAAARFIGLDWK